VSNTLVILLQLSVCNWGPTDSIDDEANFLVVVQVLQKKLLRVRLEVGQFLR